MQIAAGGIHIDRDLLNRQEFGICIKVQCQSVRIAGNGVNSNCLRFTDCSTVNKHAVVDNLNRSNLCLK